MTKKWNYKKRKYEEYELPEGALLHTDDMEKVCRCAGCGKEMTFGSGYTSLTIHNSLGFGYCVCRKCHMEEILESAGAGRKEK